MRIPFCSELMNICNTVWGVEFASGYMIKIFDVHQYLFFILLKFWG